MRVSLLIALLALAVAPAGAAAPAPAAAEFPGLGAIRAGDLAATVEALAAPELRGRLAGGPGYMKAARAMAGRFKSLGLAPAAGRDYFQPLEIEYNEIGVCHLGLMEGDGRFRWLRLGDDYTCRGLTGSATLAVPLVFAGYGISQPAKGYDDYAGLDARARVVLAFKEPPPFQADTSGWGDVTLPRPKARFAAAHGALGLLLVSRPGQEEPQKPIGSMLEGDGPEDEHFPVLQISGAVAESLLAGSGTHLAELEARIDSTRQPHPLALTGQVGLEVAAHYTEKQPSVNVVARLEGTDPARRGRAVVIGAHLDHVGSQGGEIVFPGANDNASGVASVMAIAEAFAKGGVRPRRTVIFALFSSEESGLYGSKRFVAEPPVPLDSMVCFINLDCVAHGDSIQIGGGKSSPRLWSLARDLDARGARLLVEETWPGGGADAEPFARKGVPTLYFASKPSYRHLHLTTDTPATLNPRLHEALTRLAYETAWKLAQGE